DRPDAFGGANDETGHAIDPCPLDLIGSRQCALAGGAGEDLQELVLAADRLGRDKTLFAAVGVEDYVIPEQLRERRDGAGRPGGGGRVGGLGPRRANGGARGAGGAEGGTGARVASWRHAASLRSSTAATSA